MKKNINDKQLILPFPSDNEAEYKEIVRQNWQFTFSHQHITSVHSKRVIGLIIAQMKEEGEMRDFYHIQASDIVQATDMDRNEVYRAMRAIIFELTHVFFVFENEKEQIILPRHLVDTTRFENPIAYRNGVLTIAFNPALRDMIMQLAHYSDYELGAYLRFSSWYSMRLWELLSAWKDTGWWQPSIEEYRNLMGCGFIYGKKGEIKKDKQGNPKYLKYPNTSDMIKFTTSEPLKELKGTELEFTVEPIPEKKIGKGRPKIIALRFNLVFHQLSDAEKIERWGNDNPKFKNAVERLRKWKISDKNIAKYAYAIGSERINQLLYSWQMKNAIGSKDPIGNPLVYCNKVFVAEGKQAIGKKMSDKLKA